MNQFPSSSTCVSMLGSEWEKEKLAKIKVPPSQVDFKSGDCMDTAAFFLAEGFPQASFWAGWWLHPSLGDQWVSIPALTIVTCSHLTMGCLCCDPRWSSSAQPATLGGSSPQKLQNWWLSDPERANPLHGVRDLTGTVAHWSCFCIFCRGNSSTYDEWVSANTGKWS